MACAGLGQVVTSKTWFSVVVGCVGLYLVSVDPSAVTIGEMIQEGHVLLFTGSVLIALSVILTDQFVHRGLDPGLLTLGESIVGTLVAYPLVLYFEGTDGFVDVFEEDKMWVICVTGCLEGRSIQWARVFFCFGC